MGGSGFYNYKIFHLLPPVASFRVCLEETQGEFLHRGVKVYSHPSIIHDRKDYTDETCLP